MKHAILDTMVLALLVCSPVAAEQAADIFEASGVRAGLVVQLDCGDGELTAALGAERAVLVQGLDTDPTNIANARSRIESQGLAGRVSAQVFDGRRLPYADDLVNLIIAEKPGNVPESEMMRVLCPGGVAYVRRDGAWSKTIKTRPDEVDEWTHFMHGPDNNAVSHDRVVAPPRCLQWVSDPVYGRSHEHLASLSAMVTTAGRLFSIEDRAPALSIKLPGEWWLVARDAFNGLTLWELPIQTWESNTTRFRSGPVQLPRRLVAIGDRVYVAMNYGGSLTCLDAATGTTLKTYEGTRGVDEILYLDETLYLVASNADGEPGRRILAVDAESGRIVWENREGPAANIMPATLAVGDECLFFHDARAVVALDRTTGKDVWRSPLPSVMKRPSWLSPTVLYQDGVVLCGDRAVDYPAAWKEHKVLLDGMLAHGGLALVTALSAEDGEVLWQEEAAESFHGAVDIFVINGLAWASNGPARFFFERTRPILAEEIGEDFYIETVTGRDLHSGVVKKTLDAAEAFTAAHHHRCYRDKATDRFIIMGRTGIEFINLTGGPSLRNNWTRGTCQYGVMPANGLLYTPPHPCTCYNASKVNGFFAYNSRKEAAWTDETAERLRKGPAYNTSGLPLSALPAPLSTDWPTYRHDNARSGCGAGAIPDGVEVAWRCDLSGKLSAPTSADDKVFVSAIDRHTVHALDLSTGERLWSHIAGGRVDSPPTYWMGRVYFGSADGFIQCLDAAEGTLVWRFLAAPKQASIVAWEQLESPWPVAGSVLLRDGSVYALAGRSSNLDGGMHFVKLDARTGQLQLHQQIYNRDPDSGRQAEERIDDLYMPGLLYDVPSSTGSSIFVREAQLSLDGRMMDEPETHLYSSGGFLDDTWWHRYYMIYGERFKNGPGKGTGRSGGAPSGRLLVSDGNRVYGYGRALDNSYRLFCALTEAGEALQPELATSRRAARGGNEEAPVTVWSDAKYPMMVRAMLRAGTGNAERLVLAGPPPGALTSTEVLRGEEGGLLGIVDATTGRSLSRISIDAPPVADGICIARGQIVLSLTSGSVVSFK